MVFTFFQWKKEARKDCDGDFEFATFDNRF